MIGIGIGVESRTNVKTVRRTGIGIGSGIEIRIESETGIRNKSETCVVRDSGSCTGTPQRSQDRYFPTRTSSRTPKQAPHKSLGEEISKWAFAKSRINRLLQWLAPLQRVGGDGGVYTMDVFGDRDCVLIFIERQSKRCARRSAVEGRYLRTEMCGVDPNCDRIRRHFKPSVLVSFFAFVTMVIGTPDPRWAGTESIKIGCRAAQRPVDTVSAPLAALRTHSVPILHVTPAARGAGLKQMMWLKDNELIEGAVLPSLAPLRRGRSASNDLSFYDSDRDEMTKATIWNSCCSRALGHPAPAESVAER
ncbi:hypothetical protein EVAR_47450_1 [Eumeta japonica]|uniref:Uncharacterized protein n=1 Tax=Eumeta variegata TaxID=151549 RepID=A0A4C1XCN9_EUMVA|nr:hypothetical protein EVAR_47450_1 [Eumeta japonica]